MNDQSNRITGPYSFRSAHCEKSMTADRAAELYTKLSSFLRVREPSGYYLPAKTKHSAIGVLDDWPLSFRRKEKGIQFPVAITWRSKTKTKPPTFEQFVEAYNLKIVEL